jgi:hypothetical protein
MVRADLDDFVSCFRSGRRFDREESERFRRFCQMTSYVLHGAHSKRTAGHLGRRR